MVLRAVVDLRLAAGRLPPALPVPVPVAAAPALRGAALRAAGLRLAAAALLAVTRFGAALRAVVFFAVVFFAVDFFTVDFLSLLAVALRAAGRFVAVDLTVRVAGRCDATVLVVRAVERFDMAALAARAVVRFGATALRAVGLRGDVFVAPAFRAAVTGAFRLCVAAAPRPRPGDFFTAVRFAGLDLDTAARDCPDLADFGLAAWDLATVFAPHVTTVVLQCAATDGSLSADGQLL